MGAKTSRELEEANLQAPMSLIAWRLSEGILIYQKDNGDGTSSPQGIGLASQVVVKELRHLGQPKMEWLIEVGPVAHLLKWSRAEPKHQPEWASLLEQQLHSGPPISCQQQYFYDIEPLLFQALGYHRHQTIYQQARDVYLLEQAGIKGGLEVIDAHSWDVVKDHWSQWFGGGWLHLNGGVCDLAEKIKVREIILDDSVTFIVTCGNRVLRLPSRVGGKAASQRLFAQAYLALQRGESIRMNSQYLYDLGSCFVAQGFDCRTYWKELGQRSVFLPQKELPFQGAGHVYLPIGVQKQEVDFEDEE